MWIDHLKTVADNRRRGAAKAAETRRRRAAVPLTVSTVSSLPSTVSTVSSRRRKKVSVTPSTTGITRKRKASVTTESNLPEMYAGSEEDTYYCGVCHAVLL